MTGGEDGHAPYLGDLEHLDHLACLEGQLSRKMFNMIKVLNILNMCRLSILPASMRSAHNFSNARLSRTSADVI